MSTQKQKSEKQNIDKIETEKQKPEKLKVRKSKERSVFPRKTALIGILVFLQLAIIIALYNNISIKYKIIMDVVELFGLLVIIRIVFANKNSTSKFSWIILILILPLASLAYLLWGETSLPINKQKKMRRIFDNTLKYNELGINQNIIDRLPADRIANELRYIRATTGQSANANVKSQYFSAGEDFFADAKEALKKAEKFIFMEFFIIAEGRLLKEIKEILIEKAKQGVEIKILFDDFGCKSSLSNKTIKELTSHGIIIKPFNKMRPIIDFLMNYRDHRKIIVIDGKVGYTGGVNLADEYSNYRERFGYWKDSGIKLEGIEVNDLTIMFLRMWEFATKDTPDYKKYFIGPKNITVSNEQSAIEVVAQEPTALDTSTELDAPTELAEQKVNNNNEELRNIVCAFDDAPINKYSPAKNLFAKMIGNARKYIYIQTPYLIIEESLVDELITAAKSGVDVRIFTPGIPDKKIVYSVTRSHYSELVRQGVKIFEYTPGFLHSKVLLSDDECAFVGSINMDYRSFYQQYECGAYVANSDILPSIKEDFAEIESVARQIPQDFKISGIKRMIIAVFRLFAPLM